MTGRQGQSLPHLLLAPGNNWFLIPPTYALRERDGERDRAKVMTLPDESLFISSELGMRQLMEGAPCPGATVNSCSKRRGRAARSV